MQPSSFNYRRLNRLRAESAKLIAQLCETCAMAASTAAMAAEARTRYESWWLETAALSRAVIHDSRELLDRLPAYAGQTPALASLRNRFVVTGTDARGHIVVALESKTEQASTMSLMYLRQVHPELQFTVRSIDAADEHEKKPCRINGESCEVICTDEHGGESSVLTCVNLEIAEEIRGVMARRFPHRQYRIETKRGSGGYQRSCDV